jgi:glycosyltransferase involved in cell wall biosynthesis
MIGTDRPLVSVVVPTKNRSHLLGSTLQTILGQRDLTSEIIVVDDGSAEPVVKTVAEASHSRVRVIRHDRSHGMAGARNAGIAAASGRWVAFCDDDDLWAPSKLAQQVAALRESGCAWAYAGAVHVDDHLRIVFGVPPPDPVAAVADLVHWDTIPAGASNVVLSRGVLQDLGGFDAGFAHIADWDLWLRLASKALPVCVPVPLVAYRQHAGNMSLRATELFGEIARLQQRHPDLAVDRAAFMRWVAEQHLRGGEALRAVAWLGRSLVVEPARPNPLAVARLVVGHYRHRIAIRLDRLFGRRAARTSPDWWREAETWLHEVKHS